MGVSFKVSKTGTRFRPKPVKPDTEEHDVAFGAKKERNSVLSQNKSNSASAGKVTVIFGFTCSVIGLDFSMSSFLVVNTLN